MRTPQGIAARVAGVYALAATAWILTSGYLTVQLPQPLEGMVEIGKGLLFVLVTSLLLYFVIARWTQAAADEARRAARAEKELQRVIDTAPVGMLMLDANADVTFLNPAAETLLGVNSAACKGTPFEALCGAAWQDSLAVSVSELLETGSIDGLELPGVAGEPGLAVIARAARLDRKSQGGGWVVALADNSQAAEQSERARRLLTGYRFVSEMAAVVARVPSAPQLLAQLCDLAVDVGGFSAAWAVVADDSRGGFVLAGARGLGEKGRVLVERMCAESDTEGRALPSQVANTDILIRNDLRQEGATAWREAAEESGFQSYAAFTIFENGALKAAATLFASTENYFGVEERKLLGTLKTDLTYALERIGLDRRRVAAEEALATSEEGYRKLFDAYPQPMYVSRRDNLRFLAVNDAAVAKYGFTRDEFLAMTIREIRPASEIPALLEHLARKSPGLTDAGYWTHRDSSGREFPVHVHTHDIIWDGHDAEMVMIQEVAQM